MIAGFIANGQRSHFNAQGLDTHIIWLYLEHVLFPSKVTQIVRCGSYRTSVTWRVYSFHFHFCVTVRAVRWWGDEIRDSVRWWGDEIRDSVRWWGDEIRDSVRW